MTAYGLDENNFYIGFIEITEENKDTANYCTTQMLVGYVKPKFDHDTNEWIEGATEEQVTEYFESLKPKVTKESLLAKVENYKHEYIEFVEYDGHMQRTLDSDIIKIQGAEKALTSNAKSQVQWKYPDAYVAVTDSDYFWQMQLVIMTATENTYVTEMMIIQEIDALTEEQLQTYDLVNRFDEVFKSL